ncbi:MAG: hypothetical protein K0U98_05105 [Deltaproteobacteria bacterium]|nr:hypothetical protein [Deltaproteobacteria bacterium]
MGYKWPPSSWPEIATGRARAWRNWVADGCEGIGPLKNIYINRLQDLASTSLDELYDCETADSWELCQILLELHCISDEVMSGVGIGFSSLASIHEVLPENKLETSNSISLFYLQANLLLTMQGSLSRLPKYRGIVLPKFQTPQVGLTLRSFSNNLTFHQTEIDVAWTALPWPNPGENIVNVMIAPLPFEISATSFRPFHMEDSGNSGKLRYFHYKPREVRENTVSILINYLQRVQEEVNRVDLLVIPELALSMGDLTKLQKRLEVTLLPNQMPMIISGVSVSPHETVTVEDNSGQREIHSIDPQARSHGAAGPRISGNRVFLSLYRAGKWHDAVQRKHHPWRLDSNQIEQYGLGGILSGGRQPWWEAIQVGRRRLSVFAANSWLAICPLICEDLARLDPVSDLVRGIGPSLLTAILLDGPQLPSRWSARYASVYTDDPGTSVLTVTSLGMSTRSTPSGPLDHQEREAAKRASRTVALWKDQEKGWYPISVDVDDFPLRTLSLRINLEKEASFDGRVSLDNSSPPILQGLVKHSVPVNSIGSSSWFEDEMEARQNLENYPEDFTEGGNETEKEARRKHIEIEKLKSLDMTELTLLTYYVDAIVDHRSDPREIQAWFLGAIGLEREHSPPVGSVNPISREIADYVLQNIEKRDLVPREVPTPHLAFAVEIITETVLLAREKLGTDFFRPREVFSVKELLAYWQSLKSVAWEQIESVCEKMEGALESDSDAPTKFQKEILREEERLSAEAEIRSQIASKRTQDPKRLKVTIRPHEVGRIMLMTPLSILWAAHARLSARRRFGVLTPEEVRLLREVEKDTSGERFHSTYLKWRAMTKKKSQPK